MRIGYRIRRESDIENDTQSTHEMICESERREIDIVNDIEMDIEIAPTQSDIQMICVSDTNMGIQMDIVYDIHIDIDMDTQMGSGAVTRPHISDTLDSITKL